MPKIFIFVYIITIVFISLFLVVIYVNAGFALECTIDYDCLDTENFLCHFPRLIPKCVGERCICGMSNGYY
ncbi:unnamed protein product [Trifolium pratense]|uniref:Uncharacterized protein n=1 Tax=Trifolium pratense TaxID=57577 RepID=A0ACB0KUC4_TRIPR|nr:unnamed protein product [Trifolium pratense]